MLIEWTKPAKKDLKKIYNYYQKKASKVIAQKIIEGILDATEILKTHNIGRSEDLLEHLNQGHRFVVNGNYKIICFIKNNITYITHAFDTRQDPVRLKQVKI